MSDSDVTPLLVKPLAKRVLNVLRKSGPAPCSVPILRWVYRGGWSVRFAQRFLRLRLSPDILEHLRALPLPLTERATLFSQAISQINVNETYKTTGLERTRLADAAILRFASGFDSVRLLDVGVSDGSASVHLLQALKNLDVALLTDLHPVLFRRGYAWLQLFLDGQRRILGIKLLGLYLNLSLDRTLDPAPFQTIETANPLLSENYGISSIRSFNAFTDFLTKPVQIIKCANILNRAYFPDADLRKAVGNLSRSLVPGGVVIISHNNGKYAEGEAYFALQRQGDTLVLVEEKNMHESLLLFQSGLPCACS